MGSKINGNAVRCWTLFWSSSWHAPLYAYKTELASENLLFDDCPCCTSTRLATGFGQHDIAAKREWKNMFVSQVSFVLRNNPAINASANRRINLGCV